MQKFLLFLSCAVEKESGICYIIMNSYIIYIKFGGALWQTHAQ